MDKIIEHHIGSRKKNDQGVSRFMQPKKSGKNGFYAAHTQQQMKKMYNQSKKPTKSAIRRRLFK